MDGAVDHLRAGLKGDASDLASLEMIAQCHRWAGRTKEAIAACREALGYDAGSFDTHAMLAQLLAEINQHEDAAAHARRGLECYPEPLPEIPHFVVSAIKGLSRIFPFLCGAAPDAALQRIEAERAAWLDWAKRYLSWYDSTYGETVKPKEH